MTLEIERRWLLTTEQLSQLDLTTFSAKTKIEQGYYPSNPPLRVRRKVNPDGSDPTAVYELCVKRGDGLAREESEISTRAATECGFLLEHASLRLQKTRYVRDGWELDVFHGELTGAVFLEREAPSEAEAHSLSLPDWLPHPEQAHEITGALDNLHLIMAQQAAQGLGHAVSVPFPLPGRPRLPKFVLTGGSCAGKSTILRRLRAEGRVQVVPEMATFLIGQMGILPSDADPTLFQAALYRMQLVAERAAEEEAQRLGKEAVVLDRGAMDGAAFIEGGLDRLLRVCGTTYQREQLRYDRVIQLPVPSREIYDVVKANNPARIHEWEDAKDHELRLRRSWSALVGVNHQVLRNTTGEWQAFEDAVVENLYTTAARIRDSRARSEAQAPADHAPRH